MLWTNQEIEAYRPRPYDPLLRLYEQRSLPVTDPEARAKFLAEEVLQLTMTDHDVVMRLAQTKGKIIALHSLEDMVVNLHRSSVRKHASTLSVPLSP